MPEELRRHCAGRVVQHVRRARHPPRRYRGRADRPQKERENKTADQLALSNFPNHRVLAGDLGAIVEVYTAPVLAYDVEFVNPDGSTRALLTLAPDQVRRLIASDVLTTRQHPLAA